MALTSPGVQVTVIDESFYTPAEPGTTPLIVIATAQDKSNAAGTGTAVGTTASNVNKAFKITSQRELVDTFGVPFFEQTASASPVHGGERNEYGLLAAYSYLGVSNAAFIVRADVDLAELTGQTSAPGAEPANGKWWLDTLSTSWGIQEWNGAASTVVGGQKFANKVPLVLTDEDFSKLEGDPFNPLPSVGSVGDYAIVAQTIGADSPVETKENIKLWYKSAGNGGAGDQGVTVGTWVLVGSPEWKASHPAVQGTTAVSSPVSHDNLVLNGTPITAGSRSAATLATAINGLAPVGISAQAVNNRLYIYSDGTSVSDGSTTSVDGALTLEGNWTPFGIAAGTYYSPKLQQTPHTQVPAFKSTDGAPRPTGSVWIKTTTPNSGSRWVIKRWNSATQLWVSYSAPLYATTNSALYGLDRSGGGINIDQEEIFVQTNATESSGNDITPETVEYRIWRRGGQGATTIESGIITTGTFGTVTGNSFTLKQSHPGYESLIQTTVSFNSASDAEGDAQAFAAAINAANFGFDNTDPASPIAYTNYITAEVTATNTVIVRHTAGGDIRFTDGNGTPIVSAFGTGYSLEDQDGTVNFYASDNGTEYIATLWKPLATENFTAQGDQPLAEAADGQLWYNPNFSEVDIMVHNGTTWVGYKNTYSLYTGTDPEGAIVSASEPTAQSDGTALVDNDLWISTADLENYPAIYRYTNAGTTSAAWTLIDKTDQTTEDGILFADARWNTDGGSGDATIIELLTSNFLDFDAPDPALYPKGMLLWNLRRSGGNVKRYQNNYVNTAENNPRFQATRAALGLDPILGDAMTSYWTDRWTTASPNNEDGSGSFGRKAQRALVVQKLKSTIDTSSEIRDEERRNFNLIACPGYPETLSNLINLNLDRGLTAFVVGDTPLRLPADATSLTAWGTNANGALDNGDTGIVSYDEYCAVYYPNGFTTDLGGSNAVVPASHMMLRTIALSDQVSYPWFAPAGTRRGGITNATAVGYIDSNTGEFQSIALNEGQRDTLYDLKVNPIPFFVGVGLVAYGQKTRARNASALDRINVARLVVYLRSQLQKLARPYIFEPNDKITRDEIKGAVESLLLELVGLRALYDFAVVCDESNNTDARIDRNELYVDIAIEPTKAVEFIYIPLRIKNTGEI